MGTLHHLLGTPMAATMRMGKRPLTLLLLSSVLSLSVSAAAQDRTWEMVTPPRLSLLDGEVSFWRPGVQDWTPARVNTPLAAGDFLYTGPRANCEVQIGPRAFVRAASATSLGLSNVEPDFIQIQVTSGETSVDIRQLSPGHTIEIDTPHAAFTIEHTGYYRVHVGQTATSFITRRGGAATATPVGDHMTEIRPSEELVIAGTETPSMQTYAAPDLDAWDRWNYQRTDQLSDTMSARYVPSEMYGVSDLDYSGSWRLISDYGPVWVPRGVAPGWAPYTAGTWMWDPVYGWTWVDEARWGWAPFHYGRWVFVEGFWGWAPGPIVAAPVYAPALVGFLGLGVSCGWVALGWGEPLIPWWGPPGFIGVPWWGGWRGPRIINKEIIKETTVINVHTLVYANTQVHNAVVRTTWQEFTRGQPHYTRMSDSSALHEAHPIAGALPVHPGAAHLTPGPGRAVPPPQSVIGRAVVATRAPHVLAKPLQEPTMAAPESRGPQQRLVSPPPHGLPNALERPMEPEEWREALKRFRPPAQAGAERLPPSSPPHFTEAWRPPTAPRGGFSAPRSAVEPGPPVRMGHSMPTPALPGHTLPGEPAMRLRSAGSLSHSVGRVPRVSGSPARKR